MVDVIKHLMCIKAAMLKLAICLNCCLYEQFCLSQDFKYLFYVLIDNDLKILNINNGECNSQYTQLDLTQ